MSKFLFHPPSTGFTFAVCCAFGMSLLHAQTSADPYSIGVDIWPPVKNGCPMVIGSVGVKSPAERAGIRAGDRLLAVDGKDMKGMSLGQVGQALRSDQPGAVALDLWRGGKNYRIVVQRERRSAILAAEGKKTLGSFVVPVDTTEAEVKRMAEAEARPIAGRVFPLHYPASTELYYGGFEVFVFTNPAQVVVGGLEQGPAAKAGIHQADVILSVDGVDPRGKSTQELEAFFSGTHPRTTRLVVDRVGTTKTLEYKLEKASDVLAENHLRMVNGTLIPDGLADEDIPCYTGAPGTPKH